MEQFKFKSEKDIQEYLADFLRQNGVEKPEVKIITINELPETYKNQFEFFNDERLKNIHIALVPNFRKISESHADRQLIVFKKEYFEEKENTDRIQWLAHELGHCQKFLDSPSTKEKSQKDKYFEDMQTPAFADILSEHMYPNNKVEEHAFFKQFESAKKAGVGKKEILRLLRKNYQDEKDFLFFNRVLDKIYKD